MRMVAAGPVTGLVCTAVACPPWAPTEERALRRTVGCEEQCSLAQEGAESQARRSCGEHG